VDCEKKRESVMSIHASVAGKKKSIRVGDTIISIVGIKTHEQENKSQFLLDALKEGQTVKLVYLERNTKHVTLSEALYYGPQWFDTDHSDEKAMFVCQCPFCLSGPPHKAKTLSYVLKNYV
jgi:hypothetical protein